VAAVQFSPSTEGELFVNIVQIQALRAAAAIAVVLIHFNHVWLLLSGNPDGPHVLYPLASGVDLFFVISGFIMVHSSEKLFARPGAWRMFLFRRLARIVPLYWITTFLLIVFARTEFGTERAFTSLFFIPHEANGVMTPINGVGWTLNFEMFFYVLFALAVSLPKRFAVLAVCAALLSITVLGHVLVPTSAQLRFWSDPIILEFAFGAGLALLYGRCLQLPTTLRIVLVVGGFAAVWLSQPGMAPSGNRFLLWGLPAAAIFAGAVFGSRAEGLGKMTAAANIIGDASYAIYLIHPLATTAIVVTWAYFHLPIWIELPLVFVATIVVSIFAHRFIEKKTTKALRRLIEGPPTSPEPVVAV
jgi:peptidoglycan/LPS O-acetylase OafA/YrhL